MFYESYRIARKQQKYIHTKAEAMIDSFEQKGLSKDEMIASMEVLLNEKDGSDFDQDIIARALYLLRDKEL